LLTWLSNRDLQGNDAVAEAPIDVAAVPSEPAIATQGPVVITANDAAWVDVRDGATILRQGELAAGQSFEVPATATAPTLTTAKPEALRISVGTGDAPSVGAPGVRVAGVSLLAADLLRGPRAVAPVAATPGAEAPAAGPAARSSSNAPTASPAPQPPVTPEAANTQ
jgi:cytoskeleton protein RodZ